MRRIGVRARSIAPADQALWELAADAGRQAVERGGVDPGDLDLVVVATCTHDAVMPSSAALVAAAIGAPQAGTADVNAVCNGFVTAVALAATAIETGLADQALVIGADVTSRWMDPSDRRTAPVFGDGAGAVCLAPSTGKGRIGEILLRGDATGAHLIRCPREGTMTMEGPETYQRAVSRMAEATRDVLERAGLDLEDIDVFVYHQANVRILKAVGERLGLDLDRVVNAMTMTGNTTAASIPLALDHAVRDGLLRPGSKVLASAFGSGLSYGAMLIDWEAE